jgi:AraC-like DNA-binding protein
MSITSTQHHIRALTPALEAMKVMGYGADQCLAGTGLTQDDLVDPNQEQPFSLEQQYRFHRNLLQLTDNPMLGLIIGKEYRLETFGLLGYAFMSAPTVRHAMTVLRNYGPLTFTLFRIDFTTEGDRGCLRFHPDVDIPDDLLRYYVDRDLTAALHGGRNALRESITPTGIRLLHDNAGQRLLYERHFRCPVSFGAGVTELQFDAGMLDDPMPLGDAEASGMVQQQCRMLLARLGHGGRFVDKVRQLIIARPGYFPDIDYVAEKLNMTSRTLRRRLTDEGTSFQQLTGELKYGIAREYLCTSSMPLEEISVLLGYSSPGNFTNAFKRWHGSSPRRYRQEHL